MNVTFQSYAECLITSQGKIFEDLTKGTLIKKFPFVFVMQELECILNLHVKSVFIVNHYCCPECGGFLFLNLSSDYILVLNQQCVGILVPSLFYG